MNCICSSIHFILDMRIRLSVPLCHCFVGKFISHTKHDTTAGRVNILEAGVRAGSEDIKKLKAGDQGKKPKGRQYHIRVRVGGGGCNFIRNPPPSHFSTIFINDLLLGLFFFFVAP